MCVFNSEMYHCDTARMFQKYDILSCNLGEENDGLLRGKRLCIDLGSNMLFSPKSGHRLIAPIRKEHQMEVNKNNLEDIVSANRKLGRIYVPFEIVPGEYRFIDMTQMRVITVNNISGYNCSIINQKVRDRINLALLDLLMSEEEFGIVAGLKGYVVPAPAVVVEHKEIEKAEEVASDLDLEALEETNVGGLELPILLPSGEDTEMAQKIGKAITDKLPDNEKKLVSLYSQVKGKKITKAEAAKQLGLTVESFEKIVKEMNKEEKPKRGRGRRKTGKYNGFSVYFKMYEEKKMSVKEIAHRYNVSEAAIRTQIRDYRKKQKELAEQQPESTNTVEMVNKITDY